MKDSFILYTEYAEQIDLLDITQRGTLLGAIMAYATEKPLPEMDGVTAMCFSFIRSRLDRDWQKYEETCKKRSESGRTGGRPKADETIVKEEKAKKANGFSKKQKNQMVLEETKKTKSPPDNEDEDECDSDNEKHMSVSDETDGGSEATRQVIAAWNSLGVTPIRNIDGGTRKKLFDARMRSYGLDGILEAIENARRSDFLMGRTERPFTLTFDWFLGPNNFAKVLEGNYNHQRETARSGTQTKTQKELTDFYDMVDEWAKGAT